MKTINIYTDGACSGNQNTTNIGGWGAILEYNKNQKELHGSELNTTNNRMELSAFLYALKSLKEDNLHINIFSDSSYLIECFKQKWYIKWINNGWITSNKTPVENKDLWEELLSKINKHNINFYRVKGHLNINHPNTNTDKWYKKFIEWNGSSFSKEDFLYITKMNIRADELANIGMDELRK